MRLFWDVGRFWIFFLLNTFWIDLCLIVNNDFTWMFFARLMYMIMVMVDELFFDDVLVSVKKHLNEDNGCMAKMMV